MSQIISRNTYDRISQSRLEEFLLRVPGLLVSQFNNERIYRGLPRFLVVFVDSEVDAATFAAFPFSVFDESKSRPPAGPRIRGETRAFLPAPVTVPRPWGFAIRRTLPPPVESPGTSRGIYRDPFVAFRSDNARRHYLNRFPGRFFTNPIRRAFVPRIPRFFLSISSSFHNKFLTIYVPVLFQAARRSPDFHARKSLRRFRRLFSYF